MLKRIVYSFLVVFFLNTTYATTAPTVPIKNYDSTKQTLKDITPQDALKRLMDGNKRFIDNKPIQRNFLRQAKVTSLKGQFPAAVVLSCMDSRGPAELIFDQGLGDIFSVRVAGNVINTDQLGGMEFATKVVGSKVIVVMGHTSCGAVQGACQHVDLGHLTSLLNKIQPAVTTIKDKSENQLDCNQPQTVDQIAKQNVINMIGRITEESSIINDLHKNNQVIVVGAMHDLRSGRVDFFDYTGAPINITASPTVNAARSS